MQHCFAGVPFPKNFNSIAKTILKRLFRVYAHIYHQHFSEVVQLGEEAHLNTSFKHFIFFVQEFNLIDKRELAPLQELIEKLAAKDHHRPLSHHHIHHSLHHSAKQSPAEPSHGLRWFLMTKFIYRHSHIEAEPIEVVLIAVLYHMGQHWTFIIYWRW